MLAPYVLMRRGATPTDDVRSLRLGRSWQLVEAAEAVRGARLAEGEIVVAALYDLIPTLATHDRREVIRLRREVHQGRWPLTSPSPQTASLIASWVDLRRQESGLMAEAALAFDADLACARRNLLRTAMKEPVRQGLQLSGRAQYREITNFINHPTKALKPSRRRRLESSLVSYILRSALKPSPFGAFTELLAFDPECLPAAGARRPHVRLNVGLVDWLVHLALRRLPQHQVVRLADTARRKEGKIRLVVRKQSDLADFLDAEHVVDLPSNDLFDHLFKRLSAGPVRETELLMELSAAGLVGERARRALDLACQVGLCQRGFAVNEHDPCRLERLAELLAAENDAVTDPVQRLTEIEREFGPSSAEEREVLLEEIRELIEVVSNADESLPPSEQVMKSPLYEDVRAGSPPSTWHLRPTGLEASLNAVGSIVPVFDDAILEKVGLHAFAVRALGLREKGTLPLLDVFREFRGLDASAQRRVMGGDGTALAQEIRAVRSRVCAYLNERLGASDEEVRLSRSTVERLGAQLPQEAPRWLSMSARVQVTRSGLAVLNGVSTGGGVYFSRYCDLLEDGAGWDLASVVRRHRQEQAPQQADLSALLGLNFNLHPSLTALEVLYPGACPRTSSPLSLADLDLRERQASCELEIVNRATGEVIDLVPLNFLFPLAAPALYRFLCVLAPSRTFRGGLGEHVERNLSHPRSSSPRLVMDDLVMDRRTWRLPGDALPDLPGLEQQSLHALRVTARWFREHGIPDEGFFRVDATGPTTEDARAWALAARSARLHKPHYYDVRNPFVMHVLGKQITATPGCQIRIQECLPSCDDSIGLEHGAEEFIVEIDDLGGARA